MPRPGSGAVPGRIAASKAVAHQHWRKPCVELYNIPPDAPFLGAHEWPYEPRTQQPEPEHVGRTTTALPSRSSKAVRTTGRGHVAGGNSSQDHGIIRAPATVYSDKPEPLSAVGVQTTIHFGTPDCPQPTPFHVTTHAAAAVPVRFVIGRASYFRVGASI